MDAAGVPRQLTWLRLRNIRGFRDFEFGTAPGADQANSSSSSDSDSYPVPAATLIIGRNGTNKTSLLRSIAVALCDWSDAAGLLASPNGSLVTSGESLATIEVGLTATEFPHDTVVVHREIESANGRDKLVPSSDSPFETGVFLCAYGAARALSGTDSGREYRVYDSVLGLFDYSYRLIDPELTLRRLQDYLGDQRYDSTLRGISRVLDLEPDQRLEVSRGGGIQISGGRLTVPVPIDAWADGFRLTFNWIMDFYAWAMRADRIDIDGRVPGILMIDEIDQHLHPALQAQVLPRLRDLLPTTQVIATTHSPLVALGVDPRELVSLVVRDGQIVRAPVVDLRSYSVADILTHAELFDTDLYPVETVEKLREYETLVKLGPEGRTAEATERLESVARSLDVVPTQLPDGDGPDDEAIATEVFRQFGVAKGSR